MSLDLSIFYPYVISMNPRGRPKKAETRNERMAIVLASSEKKAFQDAAELAGISVSTWVRERLRRAAVKKLEEAAFPIVFLSEKING